MNLLLWIWRVLAIPSALAVLIGTVIVLLGDPINVTALIILYAVGYVLSLSTAIRPVRNRYMYSSGVARAFLYILAAIVNAVLVPVTLIISIFGRVYRLYNYNVYLRPYDEEDPAIQKRLAKQQLREEAREMRRAEKRAVKELAEDMREEKKNARKAMREEAMALLDAESKTAEEEPAKGGKRKPKAAKSAKRSAKQQRRDEIRDHASERIRDSLHRTSANRAVNKILDESYKGDIKIDDGTDPKIYKQVALIKLSHQQYALLAERDENGNASSVASAFAIVPDARYGNTLTLVEDEALKERIFAVYRALLAEKRIYSA